MVQLRGSNPRQHSPESAETLRGGVSERGSGSVRHNRARVPPCPRPSGSVRARPGCGEAAIRACTAGGREGTSARSAREKGSASTGGCEARARSAGARAYASTGGGETGARSAGAQASASTGGGEPSARSAGEGASARTGGGNTAARSAARLATRRLPSSAPPSTLCPRFWSSPRTWRTRARTTSASYPEGCTIKSPPRPHRQTSPRVARRRRRHPPSPPPGDAGAEERVPSPPLRLRALPPHEPERVSDHLPPAPPAPHPAAHAPVPVPVLRRARVGAVPHRAAPSARRKGGDDLRRTLRRVLVFLVFSALDGVSRVSHLPSTAASAAAARSLRHPRGVVPEGPAPRPRAEDAHSRRGEIGGARLCLCFFFPAPLSSRLMFENALAPHVSHAATPRVVGTRWAPVGTRSTAARWRETALARAAAVRPGRSRTRAVSDAPAREGGRSEEEGGFVCFSCVVASAVLMMPKTRCFASLFVASRNVRGASSSRVGAVRAGPPARVVPPSAAALRLALASRAATRSRSRRETGAAPAARHPGRGGAARRMETVGCSRDDDDDALSGAAPRRGRAGASPALVVAARVALAGRDAAAGASPGRVGVAARAAGVAARAGSRSAARAIARRRASATRADLESRRGGDATRSMISETSADTSARRRGDDGDDILGRGDDVGDERAAPRTCAEGYGGR